MTTRATASASELVITGLDPYMDVIHIGESTYGKYVGSYILPDDQEEWAMLPIVMKYANANGYTDFADGLTPDYEIYDDLVYDDPSINNDLIYSYPLGNTSDAMTQKAIQLIEGTRTTSLATRSTPSPPPPPIFTGKQQIRTETKSLCPGKKAGYQLIDQ